METLAKEDGLVLVRYEKKLKEVAPLTGVTYFLPGESYGPQNVVKRLFK